MGISWTNVWYVSKEEAYATRKWVEDNDGVVFWSQVLPD